MRTLLTHISKKTAPKQNLLILKAEASLEQTANKFRSFKTKFIETLLRYMKVLFLLDFIRALEQRDEAILAKKNMEEKANQ